MIDTITAISTAVGESGIGIVRISGRDSLEIGSRIFRAVDGEDLRDKDNRKLNYGHIVDPKRDLIVDEVLIAFMKGPKTYTREDMVEIYCHGGMVSVRKILDLILENGARLAEAGEFTKRAFLNGRLDLSQAEAVIDLIKSKTDKAYEMSLSQLEGRLSQKIGEIRQELLGMLANIEASIDFPDEDLETFDAGDLEESALRVKNSIEDLLASSDRGKILKEGLGTVILGKPNVGKSSLLNALLRENRAIVTDIPGTTRDIIEEYVNIDGIPLKLVDTAGIRATDDLVEKIGVDRAREMVDGADLIIAVFDMSEPLNHEDQEILELIRGRRSIVLLNKTDLDRKWTGDQLKVDSPMIEASMLKGQGLKLLEDSIKELFYSGDIKLENDIMINNARHKAQLLKAGKNIEDALEGIALNMPPDCLEVDLKNCWDNLGEISGDTVSEDILDKIFSDFCIGK